MTINSVKINTSFEQICLKEKDFTDGLIRDYGSDVLQALWNKMKPEMQQKFASGEEHLSDYGDGLKQKAQVLLAHKVKTQNDALIHCFETVYSKEVFQRVYAAISESRRQKIENGELSLTDYIDVLRKKCETDKASTFFGTLPSKEGLAEFFKSAKVVGYAEGAQGVFFVEGMVDGVKHKLVIKASDKPAQETFATELVSSMSIKTPAYHSIDSDNPLFKDITKSLEKHDSFLETYKQQRPKQFTLMTYVSGITLENLKARDIAGTLKNHPELFYDKVLFGIGQIASADFLLYYQDRLPTIGGGNTANIMIHGTEVVAIDQVASLSTKVKMIQDPYKRMKEYVDPIVSKPEKISQAAKDIFEDALDESIQEVLDKDQALSAIQRGIVSGLARVATCSSEQLAEIHRSVPTSPYQRDVVDLEAYQKMLKTLHSSLLGT
jgi:Actin-fragmin kinase, catalytic